MEYPFPFRDESVLVGSTRSPSPPCRGVCVQAGMEGRTGHDSNCYREHKTLEPEVSRLGELMPSVVSLRVAGILAADVAYSCTSRRQSVASIRMPFV